MLNPNAVISSYSIICIDAYKKSTFDGLSSNWSHPSQTQQLPKFPKPNLWLVGGFNPSEKYQLICQIGSFPQIFGVKNPKTYLKSPPTSTFKGVPIKP